MPTAEKQEKSLIFSTEKLTKHIKKRRGKMGTKKVTCFIVLGLLLVAVISLSVSGCSSNSSTDNSSVSGSGK